MSQKSNHISTDTPRWYVVLTKSRHEKRACERIISKGFESYLPLITVVKQWSDREKEVKEPLFNGYLFVRMLYKERLQILQTQGVVTIITINGKPLTIHDEEIYTLKKVLSVSEDYSINVGIVEGEVDGDTVSVSNGPLTGINGQIADTDNGKQFIINIGKHFKSITAHLPTAWY